MLRWRSGIVSQASKAEIGARPVEQSERAHVRRGPSAIRDFIADMHQFVRGKEARQLGGTDIADRDAAVLDHIRIGYFARRPANRDGDVIVAAEVHELL